MGHKGQIIILLYSEERVRRVQKQNAHNKSFMFGIGLFLNEGIEVSCFSLE